MSPLALLGGLVIGLLAMLTLVFFVLAPPRPRVSAQRRLAPGQVQVSALAKMADRTTAVFDAAASRRKSRWFGAEELEMAGVKTESSGFAVLVVAAASVFALVGVLLGFAGGAPAPLVLLIAILFAVAAPVGAKLFLTIRTAQRRTKFGEQIDDTVQLLAGGLRAGHGLNRSITAVATEAPAPTSEELARVVNETRLGRDLPSSLATTAQRMRSADFEWVAQAIAINHETGGNLAEVLDQVGRTIRERNQIRRQVRALSAEGRLSGMVLVALPIGVFLFLLVVKPDYISVLFTNFFGIVALVVAAILMVIGTFWISRVARVEF